MTGLKHVYILGAGFSMPLGGPSFNQLISRRELDFVISHCNGISITPRQNFLTKMDEFIPNIWKSIGRNQDPNVEELLEIIDSCQEKPNSFTARAVNQVVTNITGMRQDFAEVNRLIRVRLAMSTLHFLEIVPDESERWGPYRRWFERLTQNDTILTFNYDNVVERSAELAGRAYYDERTGGSPISLMDSAGKPELLKLHGSATWSTNKDLALIKLNDISCSNVHWPQIIDDPVYKIVIGTPGMSKSRYATGVLAPIWQRAKEAIANADLVSIIGYSMPPTDTEAKRMILDQLAENKNPHLAVDIVLGPSSRSDTANRIHEIISQVVSAGPTGPTIKEGVFGDLTERVNVRPMYSQDYLDLKQPKTIREIWLSRSKVRR